MGWLNSISCGLLTPKLHNSTSPPSSSSHKQRETAPSPEPEPATAQRSETTATPSESASHPTQPGTEGGGGEGGLLSNTEPLSNSPTSTLLHHPQDSLPPPTSSSSETPPSSSLPAPPPSSSTSIPQVSSPKQLSLTSLPSISTPTPTPESTSSPRLRQLHQEKGHSISLEPPTPIDPPSRLEMDKRFNIGSGTSEGEGDRGGGGKDSSKTSAFFFPNTSPSSTSPSPLTSSPLSQTLPLSSSPPPTSSLSPTLPPSPTPSLPRGDLSPSSPHGFTHRRSGSGDSTRRFRETLNAYTTRGEEGRGSRRVNQYLMGGVPARVAREKRERVGEGEVAVGDESEGEGEDGGEEGEGEVLGKGSYASVIKCRDTSVDPPVEYAAKSFSKSRIRARLKTSSMRQNRGRGRGGRGRGGGGGESVSTRLWEEPTEGDLDSQGPVNLSLVQSEVAIMKKLNHPNVAYIHEVIDVTDDDELLIIMELCAGGPISKVSMETKGEKMEEERARDVFRQLILGVAYLHHNDIIHRDIKPDNCLFMADGVTVKLVDFGVSEMFVKKQDDKVRKSAGSPMYMAPELIELDSERLKEGIHGQATDIWSLGVTLYILVTGELPFQVDSIADLYDAIVKTEIHIPPSLPTSLQNLLSHLLSKNPDNRINMSQLWVDPWLTNDGSDPLPTYEDNCATPIAAPTRDELESALMGFRTKAQVARAANKFRTLGRRSVSEGSGSGLSMSGLGVTGGPTPNGSSVSIGKEKEKEVPVKEEENNGEEGEGSSTKTGGGAGKSLLFSPERKDTGSSFNTVETNNTSLPSGGSSANGSTREASEEKEKE